MYVDDPDQAFGSWCVKGSDRAHKVFPFSETDEWRISSYTNLSTRQLLGAIKLELHPYEQRLLQEAYEMKRRQEV